jgi:hypothetical protein
MHSEANFAGPYEVGNSSVRDLLRLGEARQHHNERSQNP